MKTNHASRPGAQRAIGAGPDTDPLWYKDAVIYQVHVRGFFDSTDDGIGDFAGLTSRLDYIQSLGVTAIWLQPFYPSPLRDDGYDIAHYEGVHPSYGTRRDFRQFLDAAHDRGLRVITELVINHTSDQHPWFQAARRAKPGSSKRDFYVWSDSDRKYDGVRIIFTDTERSNWTWDPVAGAYYWHRFFHHQPDLNFDNPAVRKAVLKTMHFWLDMGVDGMRLDAVPYLIEREGTICENLPETHAILREIRAELDARYSDRMLLAEANQWPADVRAYFGNGDECHMAFNFPLMPRLFMALKQEDRHPISEILGQTPDIPDLCQWAIFLRNHDELTLEMVADEERDYMYKAYAADPQMRLNVGIRRRLAPLLENSRPRIELLNGLLLALPGTPILYYGDEIGMGDNVYLGDRNGVRTPMQWTADRNAGFSRADPARLYAPVIMDSIYGYQSVNVEAQERSPHSLLNWMRKAISLRRQHRTFGRGSMDVLHPDNRTIFAFVRRCADDDPILVVANLARTMQAASLDLSRFAGRLPLEMSGRTELPRVTDAPYFLTLGPHAFYWLRLSQEPPSPITVRSTAAPAQAPVDASPVLVGPDWSALLDGATRGLLERRYFGPFLLRQRWFAHRETRLADVRIEDWVTLARGFEPILLAIVAVRFEDGVIDRYVVPLVLAAGTRADQVLKDTPDAVIARLGGARKGVIHGQIDSHAAGVLLAAIEAGAEIRLARGRMQAVRTSAFDELRGPAGVSLAAVPASVEQSNTSVRFGDRLMLKVVRRLWPGINPELELGRFLTESVRSARVPRLAGALAYTSADGQPSTLAMLHALVPHQTDGWRHALGDLERYFERTTGWDAARAALPGAFDPWTTVIPETARETVGGYLKTAAVLGQRTAELHLALADAEAAATLGTGTIDEARVRELEAALVADAAVVVQGLEQLAPDTPPAVLDLARAVLADPDALHAACRGAARRLGTGLLTSRVHGDYHLGQVLHHEEDFTIVDFEGEPSRPIDERRRLHSPMKDVAGMVRSFGYAAGAALAAERRASPQEADRLAPWARWWQAWTTASFLQAYRTTAGGAAFLPENTSAAADALTAFLFEKVLYEARYEMTHRPAWLGIPLAGLLDLLAPDAPEATAERSPRKE